MACSCRYRKKLRQNSPSLEPKKTIYFDYNATTPVDPSVLGEIDRAHRIFWANPSSAHKYGQAVFDEIESRRRLLADYTGTKPSNLYFCGSASEALATLINHLYYNNYQIITTTVEHSAIIKNCLFLQKHGYGGIHILPVNQNGEIEPEILTGVLDNSSYKKKALIYSPVNHETGALQNIKLIYSLAKNYNCSVILDAVQTAHRLINNQWRDYCDGGVLTAHKLYGPKGIAALFLKNLHTIRKLRNGGSQEGHLFPGTQNVPGIFGFAKAIELLKQNLNEETIMLKHLKEEFIQMLLNMNYNFVIETPVNSVSGILNISLPRIDNIEELIFNLDLNGIYLSRFASCNGSLSGPSQILLNMGRSHDRASKSLRISMGRFTKRADILTFCSTVKHLLKIT